MTGLGINYWSAVARASFKKLKKNMVAGCGLVMEQSKSVYQIAEVRKFNKVALRPGTYYNT